MKEGFHKKTNPFAKGDLFHVHTPGVETSEPGEFEYMLNTTEAGKALSSGLAADNGEFVFNGIRYKILSDTGFMDLDSQDNHKHNQFGKEAFNFYVIQLG